MKQVVTLAAVGDICLAGMMGRQVQTHGYHWPFEAMKHVLHSSDLLFGNMESVVLPPEYPDECIDPHHRPEYVHFINSSQQEL
ncbi:MAG: CapA family protein [Pirellulales bacterium]|nr:CapA family protein [Pirellulales bacterium]